MMVERDPGSRREFLRRAARAAAGAALAALGWALLARRGGGGGECTARACPRCPELGRCRRTRARSARR